MQWLHALSPVPSPQTLEGGQQSIPVSETASDSEVRINLRSAAYSLFVNPPHIVLHLAFHHGPRGLVALPG